METISIKQFVILAIAFSLPLMNPGALFGQEFVAYSATGADTAAIQAVVDAFRTAVGSPNNGNTPGPLTSGRREINWDGGGSAATTVSPTPFAGFQLIRGALFTTPGSGFVQAPPSGLATTFGNATYTFTTFSPLRLFSPIGSNITDVEFFRPNTEIAATVSAFGAVFTDVDLAESTSVEYFGPEGESLAKLFVPPANGGLSFVGLVLANERIAAVRITSGNTAPGPDESLTLDVVVMDDFIYGEPRVGPPINAAECRNGGWADFDFPREFKNQGDCIKFVRTGK